MAKNRNIIQVKLNREGDVVAHVNMENIPTPVHAGFILAFVTRMMAEAMVHQAGMPEPMVDQFVAEISEAYRKNLIEGHDEDGENPLKVVQ